MAFVSFLQLDWGDSSTSDANERQVAMTINSEDWDREVHPAQIFNEEELRQLNGYSFIICRR